MRSSRKRSLKYVNKATEFQQEFEFADREAQESKDRRLQKLREEIEKLQRDRVDDPASAGEAASSKLNKHWNKSSKSNGPKWQGNEI